MKVGLIIHDDDVVNVFFHDENRVLKRKIWIYPNGEITYMDFTPKPSENKRGVILEKMEKVK